MSGNFKPLFGTPISLSHPLGPAGGMQGCWLLNENSGLYAYDSSGQNNHGTLVNMSDPPTPTSGWGPGPHGGAVAFNGAHSPGPYITLGNPVALQISNFTIIVKYLQKGAPVSYPALVGHGTNSWSFGISNESGNVGKVFISKSGAAPYLNSTTVLTDNVEYFLAVAVNGITSNIFVNGLLETTSNSTPAFTFANSISIGMDIVGGSNVVNGLISDVMIYNRALSDLEVAILYAFPYCMFEDEGVPAWMVPPAASQYYYRHLLAGDR